MKIIRYGSCSIFSEETNTVETHQVQKEFELKLSEIPYILQILLGAFVFLVFNVIIIICGILFNPSIFACLCLNIALLPGLVAAITSWMSDTWDKRNKEILDNLQKEWDDISSKELEKAEKWKQSHLEKEM